VFWVGYRLNAAAAQRERQRKAIEDWFRALSKWVDDFGKPSTTPEYSYNLLRAEKLSNSVFLAAIAFWRGGYMRLQSR
jgi:hypothetical protein